MNDLLLPPCYFAVPVYFILLYFECLEPSPEAEPRGSQVVFKLNTALIDNCTKYETVYFIVKFPKTLDYSGETFIKLECNRILL